jgi:hypothetical protein
MLMIGRHMFVDTVKLRLVATADMEGNTFVLIEYFYCPAIIAHPYFVSDILIWDCVIMLVIGKLDGIVSLYGYLFSFFHLVWLRGKCF